MAQSQHWPACWPHESVTGVPPRKQALPPYSSLSCSSHLLFPSLCVYGCPGDDLIQTTLSIGRNLDTLTCISWLVTITGPTGKETRTCAIFFEREGGGEQSVPPCTVATRSMTLSLSHGARTYDRPMAAALPNRQRKKTQTRQKRTKFAPSRTVGPGIWAGPKIQPNKPGLFERTTKRPANQTNQPNRRPNIID